MNAMSQDMIIVHRVFRREFGLAPALVRGTGEADVARVRVLTAYLRLLLDVLQHHHDGEDLLLWPKLVERVPEQRSLFTDMDRDHAAIHAALDEARAALTSWSNSSTAADAEMLAVALERLTPPLVAHLDREETEVLPIVDRTLTPAEWGELGQRAFEALTPADARIVLAQMAEDSPGEEWAGFVTHLPPVVQDDVRDHAIPAYPAYVEAIRGASAPA